MASNKYECSICDNIIGSKEKLKQHFIRTHVSIDKVPWICSLCGFKAVSYLQYCNHVGHFRHTEALERNPGGITEFIESQSPYEVQVGRDIFLYREDEPVYRYGVDKVIDYNHKSAGTVVSCRSKEGGGSTIERRKTVDEREESSAERKKKLEDREGKGGERKGKLDSREENGRERREKSEDREERGGERRKISEDREENNRKRKGTWESREENSGERRKKSEDRERNCEERKRKSEDREVNDVEGKRKSEEKEGNGGERKKKSEDREGKGGGRKRKSEEKEGSTIERRNISGNGEQNGEKRRQKDRTSEPDKLQKKPKLTSSRGKDSNTLTKLDLPVSDTHQNLRRENGHVATNDSGAKEKTKTMKNLEENHGIGITKIQNEAQKETTFFTEMTEEPAMSFSSEQGYNLVSEPEESAEVEVEPDIDTEGQTSLSGIEGEPEVKAPWEEGALVEKITELTQSLEPLKNISKALIALDHHMRRLLPLVNQSVTGPPSSTAGLGAVRK